MLHLLPPWRGSRAPNVAAMGGAGNPIPGLSPAAYFKFNTGITSSLGKVSQWDDQSGNTRHLIQATAINQPDVQGDGSILFDPSVTARWLKTAGFTLSQPFTVVALLKQVTYIATARVFDGNANNSTLVWGNGAVSPNLSLFAGSTTTNNPDLAVNTYGAMRAIFNGASSSLTFDGNTAVTSNPGANNASGFTLSAIANGTSAANIQVKEVVLLASALSDANFLAIRTYWAAL